MIPSFETTFAVPLTCESCIKEVSDSLYKLNGITKVSADLATQVIAIRGTAAPSAIAAAIQATGRDAIVRGSGAPNSAAVCILETFSGAVRDQVRGLARMVQAGEGATVVDLSIRGLAPGRYVATVRETGDISRGPESVGGVWEEAARAAMAAREGGGGTVGRGVWGTVEVGPGGVGAVFLVAPVRIWELIGRSVVVARTKDGPFSREDPDTLVGVIARSAGVWDNDKTVCSCSGKTVWEERKEQLDRGML